MNEHLDGCDGGVKQVIADQRTPLVDRKPGW
jgi:hypothetical protein